MHIFSNKKFTGFLCILISAFFTGVAPSVTQLAFSSGLSVDTVLCSRFVIGTALIWGYIAVKKSDFRIGKQNIFLLMLVGLLMLIAISLFNECYKFLPAAIASILVFTYIIYVNIIDIATGREKASKMRFLCILLTIVGLIAVIWTPGSGVSFNIVGVAIALCAALFYALHSASIGAERFSRISAEVITAYTLFLPTIASIARCLTTGEPLMPETSGQWVYIIFLGVGTTFVANVLYTLAIKKIGVSNTAITNTMEPVYSYIAGIVLMNDFLSFKSITGGIIILSSIVILNVFEKKPGKHEGEKFIPL